MHGITIVGGGIAGLALAATLDPGRFHVTVHEQRNTLPTVETSLAMWPEARQALETVGILPEIRAAGSPLTPWHCGTCPGRCGSGPRFQA